ncbi:MAG: hypothetical protein FD174_894 [Geobacteraceae bacterium]|nr:MAG: hypothetical protein FD174_894 [Geobacteraceae bacterium]
MDKELFEQLMQSMKEAIAIAKGEMKPSRVFTVEPPDVKAIREDYKNVYEDVKILEDSGLKRQ